MSVGRPKGRKYTVIKTIKITDEQEANWDPERIREVLEYKDLVDRLVLLMIRANINSDEYGVEITEEELQSIIQRLQEENKLG